MAFLLCVAIAVGAIGFTLIVRERDIPPARAENPELRHLENRRQVLYENLKDLNFEYRQGKLSDEDYQSLKQGFLNELAATMLAIDRLAPAASEGGRAAGREEQGKAERGRTEEPQRAQAARQSNKTGKRPDIRYCGQCGEENPAANNFCGSCGQPLR